MQKRHDSYQKEPSEALQGGRGDFTWSGYGLTIDPVETNPWSDEPSPFNV